ncbi:hypothetical protein AVEN_268149-1 [Araneus ventricosus]|uniref:Uncharacterized protein n=1 Tax=Araneus ventricosus TaxID=182803 RepID=A0A4Y2V6P6_ARAVE|nr:hypothetical protein AVEN_268149-1 [Araneus ventricosus]
MLQDLSEDDLNHSSILTKVSLSHPGCGEVRQTCDRGSNKVCGHEARDGYIQATLKSRSVMPNFSKKSDFKCVVDIKKKKSKKHNKPKNPTLWKIFASSYNYNVNTTPNNWMEAQIRKAAEEKIREALKYLERLFTAWGADRNAMMKIYKATVLSKLDYGIRMPYLWISEEKSSTKSRPDSPHSTPSLFWRFQDIPCEILYVDCCEPALFIHSIPRRDDSTLMF